MMAREWGREPWVIEATAPLLWVRRYQANYSAEQRAIRDARLLASDQGKVIGGKVWRRRSLDEAMRA